VLVRARLRSLFAVRLVLKGRCCRCARSRGRQMGATLAEHLPSLSTILTSQKVLAAIRRDGKNAS
jgi:hypothetical protein